MTQKLGEEDAVFLTYEQAELRLWPEDQVHCMRRWFSEEYRRKYGDYQIVHVPRDQVLALFRQYQPQEAGSIAKTMGYGLAIVDAVGPIFFQTDELLTDYVHFEEGD